MISFPIEFLSGKTGEINWGACLAKKDRCIAVIDQTSTFPACFSINRDSLGVPTNVRLSTDIKARTGPRNSKNSPSSQPVQASKLEQKANQTFTTRESSSRGL